MRVRVPPSAPEIESRSLWAAFLFSPKPFAGIFTPFGRKGTILATIAEGSISAVVSTVSVTELLVQPFTAGQQDRIEAFERFLFSLPNTEVKFPTYSIAREAARLRSKYRVRTPDALLIATSLDEKADAFITNDARLRGLQAEGIAILVLDDFLK